MAPFTGQRGRSSLRSAGRSTDVNGTGENHKGLSASSKVCNSHTWADLERRNQGRGTAFEKLLRKLSETCGGERLPKRGVSVHQYRDLPFPFGESVQNCSKNHSGVLEAHPDIEVRMVCFDRETLGYYGTALKEQTEFL